MIYLSLNCGSSNNSISDITIGGTGQGQTAKPVSLTAPIDSFSSIVIAGIEFDVEEAITLIDGQSSNTQSLQSGMWVDIDGTFDLTEATGTASNITFSSRLAGLIESFSSDNQFICNATNVIIQTDTEIDDDLPDPLTIGVDVKVSGYYSDSDNVFLASYIGSNPNQVRAAQTKEQLDLLSMNSLSTTANNITVLRTRLEQQFSSNVWISGNLTLDFSDLSSANLIVEELPNQTLSMGKHVLVYATYINASSLKITHYQVINSNQTSLSTSGLITIITNQPKSITIDEVVYKINKFTKFSDKKNKNFGFKDLEIDKQYNIDYLIDNQQNKVIKRIKEVRP